MMGHQAEQQAHTQDHKRPLQANRASRWADLTVWTALICVGAAWCVSLRGGSVPGREDEVIRFTVNDDMVGAEVWVNGVYLGLSPVEISRKAFHQRVPKQQARPAGFDQVQAKIPDSRKLFMGRVWGKNFRQCFMVPIDGEPHYYAQVKCAGHTGFGRSGNHNMDKQRTRSCDLSIYFPKIEQRIDELLTLVRLRDYQVDPNWFAEMQQYGNRGWQTLHNTAYKHRTVQRFALRPTLAEPELTQVMHDWAHWRYLAAVHDPQSAWKLFQELVTEVDRSGSYSSRGLVGYTLRQLIPDLPLSVLMPWLQQQIKRRDMSGAAHHDFGYDGVFVYNAQLGRSRTKPSDLLVMDALLSVNRWLDGQNDGPHKLIATGIVPSMLYWHSDNFWMHHMAVSLDHPDLESYLQRSWQRSLKQGQGRLSLLWFPRDVNPWLYLLACLRPSGQTSFRSQNRATVLDLAAQLSAESIDSLWVYRFMEFLTFDANGPERCLGLDFYPVFEQQLQENSRRLFADQLLQKPWEYLLSLEPATPAHLYVQAWQQSTCGTHDFVRALKALRQLPVARRRTVLGLLTEEVHRRADNLLGLEETTEPDLHGPRLIYRTIQQLSSECSPETLAEYLKRQRYTGDLVEDLRQDPGSELLKHMAYHPSAHMREMSVTWLEQHPIAAHRQLVYQLQSDPYDAVQQAAQRTVASWARLHPPVLEESRRNRIPTETSLHQGQLIVRKHTHASDYARHLPLRHHTSTVHRDEPYPHTLLQLARQDLSRPYGFQEDANVLVICPTDQDDPVLQATLGSLVYAWQETSYQRYRMPYCSVYAPLRFVDGLGRPLAGAVVEVNLRGRSHSYDYKPMSLSYRTDQHGQLPISEVLGDYELCGFKVQHDDYGTAHVPYEFCQTLYVPFLPDGSPECLSQCFHGFIVDEADKPIAGVRVITDTEKRRLQARATFYPRQVITDAVGCFNLFVPHTDDPSDPEQRRALLHFEAPASLGRASMTRRRTRGSPVIIKMKRMSDTKP